MKREIEDLPVVSSLSFIRAIGRDKAAYRDNLTDGKFKNFPTERRTGGV